MCARQTPALDRSSSQDAALSGDCFRRQAIARSGSEAPRQSVAFLNQQSARTHEPLRVVVAILGIAPHPKAQQLGVLMAQLDGEPGRDRWVRGLRAHEHDLF